MKKLNLKIRPHSSTTSGGGREEIGDDNIHAPHGAGFLTMCGIAYAESWALVETTNDVTCRACLSVSKIGARVWRRNRRMSATMS